ncbi:hypothetical protein [Parasporobacterium paucivorans]|uniref:Uncharacterized protein n=1 Tax=Parasporobacterium paucivorans DSM 15970 TaxID=1122934 RepID=A0A1M6K1J6_9FIRM|nr:hypothetical protein [Parasporobacterium paucivorans]SHJ52785.1 hypothetical protein SAMN02745691_02116 [Parasporobacterium paucivorans DSM 15970]
MPQNLRSFPTCLFLLFLAFFAVLPSQAQASSGTWNQEGYYDISWYNSSNTSFSISTASELAGLSVLAATGNDFTGKTIRLEGNINLTGHFWIPIGMNTTNDFNGTFLGQGHTITGLVLDTSQLAAGYNSAGLFGYVNTGAVLDSLGVDVSIQGAGSDGINIGGLYSGSVVKTKTSTFLNEPI